MFLSRGDRDLGVAFQTHPGRQAFIPLKKVNNLDNHNGVVTHLEPDILECDVKWALGSITVNKPSGRDGVPAELFHILKDDAMKVLHSIMATERLHFHFSLSCIGEGNGNPLQCSCPENPRDGEAWLAAVYGVTQSRT